MVSEMTNDKFLNKHTSHNHLEAINTRPNTIVSVKASSKLVIPFKIMVGVVQAEMRENLRNYPEIISKWVQMNIMRQMPQRKAARHGSVKQSRGATSQPLLEEPSNFFLFHCFLSLLSYPSMIFNNQ